MSEDHLLLKWGTLKGWELENNEKAFELLKKWSDLGVSENGCMVQHDTDEQKKILCELVRIHTGTISNDWDGKDYTKEQAIDYIMNYGKNVS